MNRGAVVYIAFTCKSEFETGDYRYSYFHKDKFDEEMLGVFFHLNRQINVPGTTQQKNLVLIWMMMTLIKKMISLNSTLVTVIVETVITVITIIRYGWSVSLLKMHLVVFIFEPCIISGKW